MPRQGNGGTLPIPESPPADERVAGDPDYAAFEPVEVVGRGGNAVVSRAVVRDTDERVVALKEPHVTDVPEQVVDRFRNEAETWTALADHDHVVGIHGWDTEPHPWLALEYMDGGGLAGGAGDWSAARALWTGACVGTALDHAHRTGVVHLDVTPENVLLRETPGDRWPVPKVSDWGLARLLQGESRNLEGLSPRYAAPEQFDPAEFGPVGPATDVYQLGVVVYELLAGQPPFEGPPRVLREAVLADVPPPPSGRRGDLDPAIDDLLDRALAKEPADRYDSMFAFRRAMERALAAEIDAESDAVTAGTLGADVERRPPDGSPAARTDSGAGEDATTSPYDRALALADEGFVRLSEGYFARRDPAPPLEAWRRGVTLADARAGRAVDRRRPYGDAADDGESLTAHLLAELVGGEPCTLLGPPGSGKSTVCKQVACEWYAAGHGPVFYRESGRSERFDRPDALARRVMDTEGRALVVVEDAVRPAASAVFEFVDRVGQHDDVTVLVDARESEWRDAGRESSPFEGDATAKAGDAFEPIYVPRPDAREHERFVRAVEAATDRSLDVDVESLQTDVERVAASESGRDDTRPGALFYLLHRLTAMARDPLESGETPTTLTEDVAAVYDRLADLGANALDVGVCVNACNAAGIGVHPELCHAAVTDDPLTVEAAIDVLDGRAVFPREADWSEGTRPYPAVHEAWSTEFLVHSLDANGTDETEARERFGRVVTRVLALADDETARERVAGALGGDAPYLTRIEADPTAWADETAEALYALGRERPKLAALFGDGEHDTVALPDACSGRTRGRRLVWLGRMLLAGSYYDRAKRAFDRLPGDDRDLAVERRLGLARVASQRGELADALEHAERCLSLLDDAGRTAADVRSVARARARMRRGRTLSSRGDFEDASAEFRAALEGFEAAGDRRRTATTLDAMGIAAAYRSDYERAREHLSRSLEIRRQLGDRRSVADTLNNLGDVARHRGAFDRAREHHQQSLAIRRRLGDRGGEAKSLNNLGIVANDRAAFERAREYFERSLAIKRELGDRLGEANTANNLAEALHKQGAYDEAREHLERSLDLARDVGYPRVEAAALDNLGETARARGAYDRAREYHERALDVARSADFPYGETHSLSNVGEVGRLRGDLDAAAECYERALEIAEEIGEPDEVALNHHRLGEVARIRDDRERARTLFDRALEGYEAAGYQFHSERVRLSSGRLALADGDLEVAGERATKARDALADMGATREEARARLLLGRVAASGDDATRAREHWRTALATFEEVGAPQEALATLDHLVGACREAGDGQAAAEWCQRATELLETAPDPVADQFRARVQRTCGERGDG